MSELFLFPLRLFTQTIGEFTNNPVTNWGRFFNPQIIFNNNPQDAPVEAHVLSKVGSYGSQLSTLIDVIQIMVQRLELKGDTEAEAKVLREFETLRVESARAVDEARGLATPEAIADATSSLVRRHPDQLPELRERLRDILSAPAEAASSARNLKQAN